MGLANNGRGTITYNFRKKGEGVDHKQTIDSTDRLCEWCSYTQGVQNHESVADVICEWAKGQLVPCSSLLSNTSDDLPPPVGAAPSETEAGPEHGYGEEEQDLLQHDPTRPPTNWHSDSSFCGRE